MGKIQRPNKAKWVVLFTFLFTSFMFTGCERGSLGVKSGAIKGSVINSLNHRPVPDVIVRAETQDNFSHFARTNGDGTYNFYDLREGPYTISAERQGFVPQVATGTTTVRNGATSIAPVILIAQAEDTSRTTLRGYPVDTVSGRPLTKFTVTRTFPTSAALSVSKFFETAQEFKETGWTGLRTGQADFRITAENYAVWATSEDNQGSIFLGQAHYNLGVIRVQPLSVTITGTLRNLPGHVIEAGVGNFSIWAEAAGRVVASGSAADSFAGTVRYTLPNVPVTAGTVAVKVKIRGYDVVTINPAVSIPRQLPAGTIGSIDANFKNIEPIRRDLRVVVQGNSPEDGNFMPGDMARVYIKQGGKDIVPYVDVICRNFFAEAYIPGIHTGYQIQVLVINTTRGYIRGEKEFLLPEDGSTAFTVSVGL